MGDKVPILQTDVSFDIFIFLGGVPLLGDTCQFEKRGIFGRKFTEKMTNYGQTVLTPFLNKM